MNDFLIDNFVQLNAAELATIDFLYPKAQQFPDSGPYWRTACNAYGEMRYICPGIFISSAYPLYNVPESWNYHWDYLTAANALSGYGVEHTSENDSIWGEGDNPLIAIIQGYWTSFIRSKNPNTYKVANASEWTPFNGVTMQRLLFPNDPSQVRMESVPGDQRARCAYLSSIGVSLTQ